MSGVVYSLHDEEDDEDEERFLGPEDENVDLLQETSSSGGGKRRRSLHHHRSFGDSRGGGLFNLLNTLTLCFVFFGMGITQSLLSPGGESEITYEQEQHLPNSVGYVLGFLIGGIVYNKFSKYFILLVASLILGTALLTVPWSMNPWALDTLYSMIGICTAILMIGGNVICLEFWGIKSGPYIQSIHFCLSLGLLTGPLLIDPLAQTKIPILVQKALPNHGSLLPTPTTNHSSIPIINQSRIQKREIDPLLLQIFKGSTPSSPPAKLKPVFTDGRNLDNSVDWDKVKIKSPPIEEEETTTTSSSTHSTGQIIDDNLQEIFSQHKASVQKEITRAQKAIENSEQLLSWVAKSGDVRSSLKRDKRSALILPRSKDHGSSASGPFNRPYGRSRIQPPRYPIIPQGALWDNAYDDDYDVFAEDYNLHQQQEQSKLKKPPEKVEEAIETIAEYLNNPKNASQTNPTPSTDTLTSSSTTKMTSEPPTTTTKLSSTTPRTTTSSSWVVASSSSSSGGEEEISSAHVNIRLKPTSSYDNDTENPDLTILNVLNGYGVSHRNVGFILDAVYMLILAVILMLCICYNPREPRSRLLTGESNAIKEENRIFKSTVTVLLFFFSLLHWGLFVSYRRVLPRFNLLASSAPYLEQMFMGIFTTTRFFSIFTGNLIPPAALIFVGLCIALLGSFILVFMQQISTSAVWAGVILQAVGLSTLLPSSLVWGEKYISMSSSVISIIGAGLALGEVVIPRLLFTLLTLEAQTWLGLFALGASGLSGGLFLCAFLLARRQGSRSTRPRSSGYELAATDEEEDGEVRNSGEALQDLENDDFEMCEPNYEDEIDTSKPILT